MRHIAIGPAFFPAVTLLLLGLSRPAAAVDVSTCGTTIATGQTGELTGDLDCTGGPTHCANDPTIACSSDQDCLSGCIAYAVHLAPHATLNMNGHTISGGDYGVLCRDSSCKVNGGGGTIANEEFSAIWLFGGGKLVVNDLTIHDTFRTSIFVAFFAHRLVLRNVTVYNNSGIETSVDVAATNVTLSGSPPGTCGFQGNLQGRHVVATNVTAGYVSADRLRAKNLTVNGVCTQGILVQGSTSLIDSSITGATVDVATGRAPHLVNTTCGTSAQLFSTTGANWGVCTND
jgi:hypothetical protein